MVTLFYFVKTCRSGMKSCRMDSRLRGNDGYAGAEISTGIDGFRLRGNDESRASCEGGEHRIRPANIATSDVIPMKVGIHPASCADSHPHAEGSHPQRCWRQNQRCVIHGPMREPCGRSALKNLGRDPASGHKDADGCAQVSEDDHKKNPADRIDPEPLHRHDA